VVGGLVQMPRLDRHVVLQIALVTGGWTKVADAAFLFVVHEVVGSIHHSPY
jgi:hypothetical protein